MDHLDGRLCFKISAMMFNGNILITFITLVLAVNHGSVGQFCVRTIENCEGSSCNVTIPCEHGKCTDEGRCQCDPCWDGKFCRIFTNRYPPIFLDNTEEIFLSDPWTTAPIYTAKAYDEDFDTTCSVTYGDCECAKIRFSLISTSQDGIFFLNNSTGDLYVIDGNRLNLGQTYTLHLSVYQNIIQHGGTTNQSNLELKIVFNDFYHHIQNGLRDDRFSIMGQNILVRRKRELEDAAKDTEFEAENIFGGEKDMKIGQKYVYEVTMKILPTGDEELDMTVEFFTKDIENADNKAVLCVFNAKMDEEPAGVTVSDMKEEMLLSDQLNSTAYDRIIFNFKVKNTNDDISELKWKCSITQVRNPDTKYDTMYLFNIGVEYFDETYIWVTQFPITVHDFLDETKTMKLEVEHPENNVIPLDSAGVFLIKAYPAIRSDKLVFEVIVEDTYKDIVSVGNLGVKDFAENYDPVPQNIYYYNTTMTGSDEEYVYSVAKLDLGVMTNVGDYTAAEEPDNLITLTYAIYPLNIQENVDKEIPFTVNFYIEGGPSESHTGNFKITAREEKDKTITSRNISSSLANPNAAQGDMVMYEIWSNLTNNGYAEFVLQVTVDKVNGMPQLEPCSARLWKYPKNFDIPFLNTTFIDPEIEDDKYIFKFDRFHVTDQRDPAIYEDSIMLVHLIFKVSSLINEPGKELNPKVHFGTQGNVDQDEEIPIEKIIVTANEAKEPPGLSATNAVPWQDLYVGGAMVLNVTITVPMGLGYSETYVEISGAKDPEAPAIRVCRAELTEVGKNLPCLRMHQNEVNQDFTTYNMSNDVRTEPDVATLVLGDVGSLPVEGDNHAVVSYIFELPAGSTITDNDPYSINSGVNIRKEILKEFVMNYTMKIEPPSDLEKDAEPDVNCTLVDDANVLPGHVAEVLIHIHTKIQTIAKYSIELEAATSDTCMFGMKIMNFGLNLPCVNIDTEPLYELHENTLDGNKLVGLDFPALSNIGFHANPEHDVLVVKALVRVNPFCKEDKVNVNWKVVYGSQDQNGVLEINVDQTQDSSSVIIEGEPELQVFRQAYPNVDISIGTPVVVDFEVALQNNSVASVLLSIQNAASSEKKGAYDVCLGGVWFRGKNYPCFSPLQILSTFSSSDSGNGHNDTASYDLGVMCNTFFYKNETEENKVIMRIAMRPTDDGTIAIGDSFEIQGDSTVGTFKSTVDSLKFTIAAEAGQVENGEPSIKAVGEEIIEIGIRERKWVAFNITIPEDSIFKIDVTAKAPLQDERAIMTVHDMRLVSGGINIPCVMLYPELKVQFIPEVKTTQSDVITAHVGYFTNLGLTNRTNLAVDGDDDITIEVEVEMSDHPETTHEAEFQLVLEAQVGTIILEAKQILKVSRTGQERAYFDVDVQVDDTKVYQSSDPIDMVVTIAHNDSSRAEPVDTIIRIFLPPYIEFKNELNINATNIGKVTPTTEKGGLDLVFPQFLFTDTAVVGVQLLSDPNNKRGYGRGEVNATTPYRVLCLQTYRTEPSANPEVENSIISCSPMSHVVYTINSLECYQALGLSDSSKIKDCQLSASSAAKKETGPQNIRIGSEKGWSPALRLGMGSPYFQVDFQQITRVAGIKFVKVDGTRCVTKYRIQYSYTGSGWMYANDVTDLQFGDDNEAENKLEKPIQTRFIRIVIEEAESEDEDSKYIGIQMEIFGCFIAEKSESVACPKGDSTWYSDDTKKYGRHFSIDTERNIAYFCDLQYNVNNVLCFSTADVGNSCRVLPQNFGEVVGFDPESSLTYVIDKRKRAYMASDDGVTWVPVKYEEANATISKDSFVLSYRIPAFNAEDISNLKAKSGKWEATFDGLVYEGKDGLVSQWSKCCSVN